jgi:hypothetical protein
MTQLTLHGVGSEISASAASIISYSCFRPSGAATNLGLPARTLDSKIKRLKINKYR